MEMENKIKCVLIDFEQGEITLSEATNTILRLFSVSGHVQNYKDCKLKCKYRDIYKKSILKRG